MDSLSDIYSELVMEHSMNSPYKRKLPNADMSCLGHNPNCGDEITIELNIEDNKIKDVAFTGHGCAISQSSTSIMMDTLIGKPLDEAKEIIEIFIKMIDREELTDAEKEKLGDSLAFENISNMPARVKCALLPWKTLKGMLETK